MNSIDSAEFLQLENRRMAFEIRTLSFWRCCDPKGTNSQPRKILLQTSPFTRRTLFLRSYWSLPSRSKRLWAPWVLFDNLPSLGDPYRSCYHPDHANALRRREMCCLVDPHFQHFFQCIKAFTSLTVNWRMGAWSLGCMAARPQLSA